MLFLKIFLVDHLESLFLYFNHWFTDALILSNIDSVPLQCLSILLKLSIFNAFSMSFSTRFQMYQQVSKVFKVLKVFMLSFQCSNVPTPHHFYFSFEPLFARIEAGFTQDLVTSFLWLQVYKMSGSLRIDSSSILTSFRFSFTCTFTEPLFRAKKLIHFFMFSCTLHDFRIFMHTCIGKRVHWSPLLNVGLLPRWSHSSNAPHCFLMNTCPLELSSMLWHHTSSRIRMIHFMLVFLCALFHGS